MKGYDLYQEIQLNISPNDLDRILYHASYQPQDDDNRKKNKDLLIYGKSVVKAAVAVYVYINNIFNSASEITKAMNLSLSQIIDAVYDNYELENYLYISNNTFPKCRTIG